MGAMNLAGRLAVETICLLKSCCADSILKWHPRMLGERKHCLYCDNPMKTVSADEVAAPEWSGMLNETRIERAVQDIEVAEMWFTSRVFSSLDAVKEWCEARGIDGSKASQEGTDTYKVSCGEVVPGTERTLWADRGVVAVFGISKIDTGSMATGGTLHPYQGKVDKKPADTSTEKTCGADHDDDADDTSTEDPKDAAEKAMSNFNSALEALLS